MSKYLVIGLLVVGIAVASYIGCDGAKARIGVAQDAAIEKIDALLGPLNIKAKEVENAFAELETASDSAHEARLTAGAKLKRLLAEKVTLAEKKAALIADLTKLKPMLKDAESSGTTMHKGEEVPIARLQGYAESTMSKLTSLEDEVKKNDYIANVLNKNFTVLKANDEANKKQLKKLGSQLEQIRSKKSALDGMREAASIAGPGASISDKFNDLTKSVDDLMLDLDVKFEIEQGKIDKRIESFEEGSSPGLDEFLEDKADISSTQDDMDKWLNEAKDQ